MHEAGAPGEWKGISPCVTRFFIIHTFQGHNSATMVLMIPTFPFPAPDNALAVRAMGSVVENPHSRLVTMVLNKPSKMTGFRPYRSEARPQRMAVRHWKREKMAAAVPAQKPTSASSTPSKDPIIAGR
jgi:hypothetical protein